MLLIAAAIKRAGTTEAAPLRNAIAATRDFAGVTGRTTIDPQRNSAKSAVILTLKDGQAKFVDSVSP